MAKRLVDLYRPGDEVEILLDDGQGSEWTPGRIIAHDFPAVWVQTDGGGRWFVTNRRRIRSRRRGSGAAER